MSRGREARIWATITARSDGNGTAAGPSDVCHACVAELGMAGAAIVVLSPPDRRHVSGMAGPLADLAEDLQTVVGEGPVADVWKQRRPVLARPLTAPEYERRWPAFTPGAVRLGVGAAFAFPLQAGAIRLGVFSLYRESGDALTDDELADALLYADAATIMTLGPGAEERTAASLDLDGLASVSTAVVYQATGMVSVQLGSSVEEAFVRLRAYAYAHDRRLADVARDIVGRRLRLTAESEHDDD